MDKEAAKDHPSFTFDNALEQSRQSKKRDEIINSHPDVRDARLEKVIAGTILPRKDEIEDIGKLERAGREAGAVADHFQQLRKISSREAKAKEPELSSADSNFLKSLRSQEAKAEFIVNAHQVWEAQALKREESKMMQAMGASPERIKEIEAVGGFKGAEILYRRLETELKDSVSTAQKVLETDGAGQRLHRTAGLAGKVAKDPLGSAEAYVTGLKGVAKQVYESVSDAASQAAVSISGGTNAPEIGNPLLTSVSFVKSLRGR